MRKSVKQLLIEALYDAIQWEESRLDADCFVGNQAQITECEKQLRLYRSLLDKIDKNRPLTLRDYLNQKKFRLVSLDELKEIHRKQDIL